MGFLVLELNYFSLNTVPDNNDSAFMHPPKLQFRKKLYIPNDGPLPRESITT